MVLSMKNLNILGFTENLTFRGGGGGSGKTNIEGEGAWTVCRFRRAWQERVDTPMHTMGGGLIPQCTLWEILLFFMKSSKSSLQ